VFKILRRGEEEKRRKGEDLFDLGATFGLAGLSIRIDYSMIDIFIHYVSLIKPSQTP